MISAWCWLIGLPKIHRAGLVVAEHQPAQIIPPATSPHPCAAWNKSQIYARRQPHLTYNDTWCHSADYDCPLPIARNK